MPTIQSLPGPLIPINHMYPASTSYTDYRVVKSFCVHNRPLRIAFLQPAGWVLNQINTLYAIGFGDDLAISRSDHVRLMESGVTFGVLDHSDNLVGLRVIADHWRDSVPVDSPFLDHHQNLCYLNHTIIHPAYRNSAVGTQIAEQTIKWLIQNQSPGIRASVAPWNLKNIGYATKNGYRVTSFVRNLYGPGEHRAHICYDTDQERNTRPDKKLLWEQVRQKAIPIVTDRSHKEEIVAVSMYDSKQMVLGDPKMIDLLDYFLNQKGYDGFSVLKPGETGGKEDSIKTSLLILKMNPQKDLTLYTAGTSEKRTDFANLEKNLLLKDSYGHFHTLHYALRHPDRCFELDYSGFSDQSSIADLMRFPLRDKRGSVSSESCKRTELIPFSIPERKEYKGLFALDATKGLTRSMKDHATEFVAGFISTQKHIKGTILATTGNMGASEAAAMRSIGRSSHIFLPQSTPEAKLQKIKQYGGEIHPVDGDYDMAVLEARKFAEENPEYLYSGETVLRLTGNILTSKMIVDRLGGYPDYVLVPVGDGSHYLGLLRGFQNLNRIKYKGGYQQCPKMIGVQADGCNPIFRAYRDRSRECTPQVPHTPAEAVAVGNPIYGRVILTLLDDHPELGDILSVSESKIPAARSQISKVIGVDVEESSALVWIGLQEKLDLREIESSSKVVLALTGG